MTRGLAVPLTLSSPGPSSRWGSTALTLHSLVPLSPGNQSSYFPSHPAVGSGHGTEFWIVKQQQKAQTFRLGLASGEDGMGENETFVVLTGDGFMYVHMLEVITIDNIVLHI